MSNVVMVTSNLHSNHSEINMPCKDTFIVYRSFYEATKPLSDEDKLALFDAIFEFGLNHKESDLAALPKAMFSLMKPILEANHKRWLNGKKGGSLMSGV